jgi:hypothetical protein
MKNKKRKQCNGAENISTCKPGIIQVDKQQDSKGQKDPPAPGYFVGYSYNCGHTIHEVYPDFTENIPFCPSCTTLCRRYGQKRSRPTET